MVGLYAQDRLRPEARRLDLDMNHRIFAGGYLLNCDHAYRTRRSKGSEEAGWRWPVRWRGGAS